MDVPSVFLQREKCFHTLEKKILTDRQRGQNGASCAAVKFRAMIFCPAAPERQPKARRGEVSGNDFLSGRVRATTESKARRKTRQRPGGRRDKSMHRRKAALRFRAMIFCLAAPGRQPKARRGEKPGNARAAAATNPCTEGKPQ